MVPQRVGPLADAGQRFSLPLGVAQHVTEPAAVHVEGQLQQVLGVELEGAGVEMHQLVDAVQELDEDRRYLPLVGGRGRRGAAVLDVAPPLPVGRPQVEGVAEAHEVLLHQHAEAVSGSVVGVQEQLREARHLRRPVPPVAAVDQDGHPEDVNPVGRLPRGRQDGPDVGQPLRVLDQRAERDVGRRLAVADAAQLLVAVAHGVDVLDIAELQGAVGIVGRVFVAVT